MQSTRPAATETEHRVLKFRPRDSTTLRDDEAAIDGPNEPDDFQDRMWTNVAALAFTAALVGCGIWLAVSLSESRKAQDCVLMGRRDCAHLSTRATPPAPTEPQPRDH
ncbi:MAG: hypothetical protein JWR73_916 [Tardiphaga sp.]|nr:hypothetical protein [Tardiphaga sp.]MDB5549231.1 hypothetical protein [Tardiphaga sp.]MDB5625114.1 hypothetical protein [Tardiphaga sp.]